MPESMGKETGLLGIDDDDIEELPPIVAKHVDESGIDQTEWTIRDEKRLLIIIAKGRQPRFQIRIDL